jgi:hypothetical protein
MKKIFTAPFGLNSQFLHRACAILCTMSNKSLSYREVELCAHLAITVGFEFGNFRLLYEMAL